MRQRGALSIGIAVLSALLTRGGPARADTPAAPIDVTVRGSQAPGFVGRASADDRAREAVDAASILAELPSVHVRRLGADGAQALLSIRGSASTQVGVLLAGIPDPSLDVGSLPLWPGATFRVYRGFAPASLGTTGHLGGLLVIDPPTPLAGARTEWQAIAGSFGALKVRAGETRVVGDLKIGAGVFGARADNDFPYEVTRTGDLVTQRRSNAGYVAAGAIGRAALERPWGTVGATLFADARRLGLPGAAALTTAFPRLETSRLVAGVDATIRAGDKGSFRAQLWGRREHSLFADPRGELEPTRTTNFAEQGILAAGGSIGYRGAPFSSRANLAVFLDARGEDLSPSEVLGGFGGVAATRIAGGLGVELDVRAAERLRLFATGRLDARRDRATGASLPPSSSGDDPSAADDLVPSGHVGASYRFGDAAVLSAHAGALRRFPSFVELYGDRGSLIGDARLRVERAYSADLGLTGDVAAGRVVFRYELVGFVTAARDLIVFLPLGRSTFRAGNVDSALLGGVEVSASLVATNLTTTVSYTLLGTENTSEDPLARGRALPGRPVHDLSYDASYRFGPFAVRYGIDAVAGTTVDTGGTIVLPPRFFHGAGLGLHVPRTPIRFGLEVQNLFDVRTRYIPSHGLEYVAVPVSDFLGFPLPGRTVWATVRYRAP
jgi:vitamin B12 transporter